ncbi:hypothetical protein EXIGLDRAFT_723089 [Exidia glandulosa HHB12029]|uniref:Uncharacterized protein n=1 Tax=Exidia glandulosa HHB12029 TaxID=1314781 RepID=A0A165EYM6_EXIGL|nr:hypothetical protein EXIGLDRAFT_723089 [Exidia glandulosa HHB12029]
MPALTSLVFDPHPYLMGKMNVDVSRSLLEATLPLPDVRSLYTSSQCYALAGVFPRVARLSLDISRLEEEEDALRWSTASRNVTNLALNSPVIWGPVVQTLVSGMVHIEELTFTEHISLENDLALFSSLEAVTSLNLPRLYELYLGYPPPYGDADADLEAHLTQDERERKQQKLQQLADDARMKAKDIARRIFPCIRILRIKGDCVCEFTV